jgi:hypothetical protein
LGARNVFVKVNSDAAYRAKFLKDPVGVLKSEGITLSATDQRELLAVIDDLKRALPNLGALPRGYEALIQEVGEGHHDGGRDEPPMLMV